MLIALGCVIAVSAVCSAHSDFAAEVVTSSGPFGGDPYNDPQSVIGKPTTEVNDLGMPPFTPPGVHTPSLAYPAAFTDCSGGKLVVTLGQGAEVIVRFDHRVIDHPGNWYGRDFIVYGNAFFEADNLVQTDTDMEDLHLTNGTVNAEPISVSVSSDGLNWLEYDNGPYADSFFPTNPFKWDRQRSTWGTELDWTKPVDPSLSSADFAGLSVADAIDLYAGSAGGTSFDLQDLPDGGYSQLDSTEITLSNGQVIQCKYIQYVKVASAGSVAGEVDGLSDVAADPSFDPGPIPGDLNSDGFVGSADLDIVLDHWGQIVPAGNILMGDASGDGFVGQDDLDVVLDHWGQGTIPPEAGQATHSEVKATAMSRSFCTHPGPGL